MRLGDSKPHYPSEDTNISRTTIIARSLKICMCFYRVKCVTISQNQCTICVWQPTAWEFTAFSGSLAGLKERHNKEKGTEREEVERKGREEEWKIERSLRYSQEPK